MLKAWMTNNMEPHFTVNERVVGDEVFIKNYKNDFYVKFCA